MTERHPETPHTDDEKPDNKRRTRWGRILLPLTTIVFLFIFIGVMLVIYLLAR